MYQPYPPRRNLKRIPLQNLLGFCGFIVYSTIIIMDCLETQQRREETDHTRDTKLCFSTIVW